MKFLISVIIPVYNAEPYLEKALKSVLIQSEVAEIIVVNDGSKDNSLSLIKKFQNNDKRIKIFHHKNKVNKGRAASRNLALKNVSQPFVAFLDADDYYLENRFLRDKQIFERDKTVDGVYNAIGAYFYKKVTKEEEDKLTLTTITEAIPHSKLFSYLLNGKKGYFSIDGLTIKKELISKIGLYQEELVVAEDTDWILKMAMKCKLVSGNIIEPVAIRGVHDENIFNKPKHYKIYRQKMYESLISWSFKNNISKSKIDLLLNYLFYYRYKEHFGFIKEMNYWILLLLKLPKMFTSPLAIKYCPIIRQRKKLFPILFK